ncbi:MAG: Gfo/Idh/MocA family oxidoreductase [Armatimonadota bacterium]|nr:Gfo/Idh/MocA family oxidoreductase [bacterium]MDW8321795.1 Gfo/Idh/MocA family oxidoreductase [Armatimonadota bacterium]
MERVRFGVIGVGGMGVAHATLIQRVEEAVLAAVCSASAERTQQVARQFGVPGFTDYRRLLGSGMVDAVLIATPHPTHAEIALCAFEQGVHVLCEKPLAVSVSEGRRMVECAQKQGCLLGAMLQMRTEKHFRIARRAVEEGIIGNLLRAHTIATWCRNEAYYRSAAWRGTWSGEGGGVLINQAPHHLDIFCWLVGMPRQVTAQVRTRYHQIEVEDEAFALLEYPNGAHGYLYVNVNEMPPARRFEVVGERGKVVIDGEQVAVTRIAPPIPQYMQQTEDMWELPVTESVCLDVSAGEQGHEAVIRNFARVLLGREERLVAPGEEALWSLELANAIILSAKQAKSVTLPLDGEEYDALLAGLRSTSQEKPVAQELRRTDPNIARAIRMEQP